MGTCTQGPVNLPIKLVKIKFLIYQRISREIFSSYLPFTGYNVIVEYFSTKSSIFVEKANIIIKHYGNRKSF